MKEARSLKLSREAYYGQAVVKWRLRNSLLIYKKEVKVCSMILAALHSPWQFSQV